MELFALDDFVASPTDVEFEDVGDIVVEDAGDFVVTDFFTAGETIGFVIDDISALETYTGEAAEVEFPNGRMGGGEERC